MAGVGCGEETPTQARSTFSPSHSRKTGLSARDITVSRFICLAVQSGNSRIVIVSTSVGRQDNKNFLISNLDAAVYRLKKLDLGRGQPLACASSPIFWSGNENAGRFALPHVCHSCVRTNLGLAAAAAFRLHHSCDSSADSVALIVGVGNSTEARNSISCLVRSSSSAKSFSSGRVMRYSEAITLFVSPSRA